jgi:TetR/AcrR family transcriptional regulator
MARTRASNYDDQKKTILAGAADLFARRGYLGTSMNDVAEACRVSKGSLYHYYRDKDELLVCIAETHVTRLVTLVKSVEQEETIPARDRLQVLITRFLIEYSDAQNSHRVLTEDVKYLPEQARRRILDQERLVVKGFADAIAVLRPDTKAAGLHKAVAMLLFGMLNWMFTWLRPGGSLTHAAMAPLVCELFFHGLEGMREMSKKPKSLGKAGVKP